MHDEFGDMTEIMIGREQWEAVFQGMRSNPIVRVWQLDASGQELRPKPTIDCRRSRIGLQDFKRVEEFTGFLKGRRRDLGMRLAEKEFPRDVSAEHRWIVSQDERFGAPISSP